LNCVPLAEQDKKSFFEFRLPAAGGVSEISPVRQMQIAAFRKNFPLRETFSCAHSYKG